MLEMCRLSFEGALAFLGQKVCYSNYLVPSLVPKMPLRN